MAPPTLLAGRALARTYDTPGYADPWECVEDYFEVLGYTAEYPEKGRTAVGRALGLPPSRVREWMNGSVPDCVRGLKTADGNGWLDLSYRDRTFRGLNAFVAWTFSGGSINRVYVPYFVVEDDDRDRLDRAADAVGVDLDFTRRAEPGRATELRPVEDASVLGRVLAAMGAPVGQKNDRAEIALPAYLEDAPATVRREFARTYLENRGELSGTGDCTFREERPERYLRSLAALVADATGERVTVNGRNVVVSAPAVRAVSDWPPVLDGG